MVMTRYRPRAHTALEAMASARPERTPRALRRGPRLIEQAAVPEQLHRRISSGCVTAERPGPRRSNVAR